MKIKRRRRLSYLVSDISEFEAVKAQTCNLDPDTAAQQVAFLQRQYRRLWSGQVRASPVDLNPILNILKQKRIPFVLTGAHGIASWRGQPRNTQDVDILVKDGRNYNRAVNALRSLYPELELRRLSRMTSFYVPGEKLSVIDVVCPLRADNEETLANAIWTASEEHGLRYRVPSLEQALANKYGAMLDAKRSLGKRCLDMADFVNMVAHSQDEGRQPIDLPRLEELGEMVRPGGGGNEVLRLVKQVMAGKAIDLNSLG